MVKINFTPELQLSKDRQHIIMLSERALAVQNISEATLPLELVDEPLFLANFIAGYECYNKRNYSLALNHFKITLNQQVMDSTELRDIHFYTGTSQLFLAQGQNEMDSILKKAIKYLETAKNYYNEIDSSLNWAATINNLGVAYSQMRTGDKKQNLKKAITAFETAMRIFNDKSISFAQQIGIENNLGVAFLESSKLDHTQDPIKAFNLFNVIANKINIKKDYPILFAAIHNNRGNVYVNLPGGNTIENLEKAITSFDTALIYFDKDNLPINWAMVQNNRAMAYAHLPNDDRVPNFEIAISVLKEVLEVFNKKDYKFYWSMIQNNMGEVQRLFSKEFEAWVNEYSVNNYNFLYDKALLNLDNKGNAYVAYLMNNSSDIIIKYNSNGIKQWKIEYSEVKDSLFKIVGIAVDKYENVYINRVNTSRYRSLFDYLDTLTIKYDKSGKKIWEGIYDTRSGEYRPKAIATDNKRNVYVTGIILENKLIPLSYKLFTIKYNKKEKIEWKDQNEPSYNYNYRYGRTSLKIDNFGNVYVLSINRNSSYEIIKYNNAGIKKWIQQKQFKKHSPPGFSNKIDNLIIAIDVSSNVYVAGTDDSGIFIIKYNEVGEEMWTVKYDESDYIKENTIDIEIDHYSNIYVLGARINRKHDCKYNDYDYLTIKYDNNGVRKWIAYYDGIGKSDESVNALAIDSMGNIYVSGMSRKDGESKFILIKYLEAPNLITN